jgi:hypothetical protein
MAIISLVAMEGAVSEEGLPDASCAKRSARNQAALTARGTMARCSQWEEMLPVTFLVYLAYPNPS